MRKSTLGSLTGLLLPLAAYAAPTGYAYQRRQPLPRGMYQPLMPMKRIGLSRTGPEKVGEPGADRARDDVHRPARGVARNDPNGLVWIMRRLFCLARLCERLRAHPARHDCDGG